MITEIVENRARPYDKHIVDEIVDRAKQRFPLADPYQLRLLAVEAIIDSCKAQLDKPL